MAESSEMYLENILTLGREQNKIRAIDLSERMGYSKPSVSRALNKLKDEEYILVDQGGYIALTEKGRALAEKIYERHELLSKMLMYMSVDRETALKDACRMEHFISDESIEAIKAFLKKRNIKL